MARTLEKREVDCLGMIQDKSDSKITDIFVEFLKSSCDYKYRGMISRMASQGARHIVVDFIDLMTFDVDLAVDVQQSPRYYLPLLNAALYEVLSIENSQYCQSIPKWALNVWVANLTEKIFLRQTRLFKTEQTDLCLRHCPPDISDDGSHQGGRVLLQQ